MECHKNKDSQVSLLSTGGVGGKGRGKGENTSNHCFLGMMEDKTFNFTFSADQKMKLQKFDSNKDI